MRTVDVAQLVADLRRKEHSVWKVEFAEAADTIESLQATCRMAADLLRREGYEHAAQSVEASLGRQ